MTQLVEVREPGLPSRSAVIEGVVEVGRDASGILLSDPETSRRHAALTSVEDFLTVRDLGSTNGTSVNGAPIQAETLLNPGDVVGLGDVRIVVLGSREEATTPGNAPAPYAAEGSAGDTADLPVGPMDPPDGGAAGRASALGSARVAGSATPPGTGPQPLPAEAGPAGRASVPVPPPRPTGPAGVPAGSAPAVGSAHVGSAQVGSAQVGSAQVGSAQVGSAQVGSAQVGSAQVGSA
ncbi:FHA domain-containing protein, partial [Cryptosporangium sp. NPDC051539]|uniref:FHA domain-containing protein n=1 Tax=Cryptosporangium sp. NPDC051539 TaxID=3363962 RepID=UPI0037A37B4D